MTFQKTVGPPTFEVGVDFIHNPSRGGFFEFNSHALIRFGATQRDRGKMPINAYPQGFATPGLVTEIVDRNGNP